MIYITGDTHGSHDISKLNTTNFPQQKQLDKEDYLIITGDFGCV
jgi:predicted phosphodiesterase